MRNYLHFWHSWHLLVERSPCPKLHERSVPNNYIPLHIILLVSLCFQRCAYYVPNSEIYLTFVWDSVDDKRTDRDFSLISFILASGTDKNTPPRHTPTAFRTASPWLEYIVKFRSKQESGHKYPPVRNNNRVTFCLYLRGRCGWTGKRIYGLFAIFGFHV